MKRFLSLILVLVLVACTSIKDDYEMVTGDIAIKQISEKEVMDIFEDGTGVIIFSFPESPWCQEIMPVLNEQANVLGAEINYFNVEEIRTSETENYKVMYGEIISYLETINYDLLTYEKIWVPTVIAVKDGEVVDFNVGTTFDHDFVDDKLPPLTDLQKVELRDILNKIIQKVELKEISSKIKQ